MPRVGSIVHRRVYLITSLRPVLVFNYRQNEHSLVHKALTRQLPRSLRMYPVMAPLQRWPTYTVTLLVQASETGLSNFRSRYCSSAFMNK